MYSKDEASLLRKTFWTTFGQYMKPIPSSEGLIINWINYKTGVSNIQLKMTTEHKNASIGIYLMHKDESIRSLIYEQFLEFRKLLELTFEESWDWDAPNVYPTIISKTLTNVSILNQNDWPTLISFFKPRLIAFDVFWENAKLVFKELDS